MHRKGFVPTLISLAVLTLPVVAMAIRVTPQEEAAFEKAWGFEVDLSVFLTLLIFIFAVYPICRLIRKYIFKKTSPRSWLADLSIIFGFLSVFSLVGRIGLTGLQLFRVDPIGQIGPNCMLLLPMFGAVAAFIAILLGVADRIKEKWSRIGISLGCFTIAIFFLLLVSGGLLSDLSALSPLIRNYTQNSGVIGSITGPFYYFPQAETEILQTFRLMPPPPPQPPPGVPCVGWPCLPSD